MPFGRLLHVPIIQDLQLNAHEVRGLPDISKDLIPPAAPILRASTETNGFVLVRCPTCYYVVNSTSKHKK